MVKTARSDFTPEQLAGLECAYWVHLYKIQLQAGMFTFDDHQYLAEPMESVSRVEVTIKGTQGGYTECEVLRSLHSCIYGHTPQGLLYLFPTEDDVLDFSKTRFNTLIQNNPESIGKFVKAGGRGTDSASLKKVGSSFIYFRSGKLTRIVGNDTKEAARLRSIPVDKVVFDEYDLMDEEVCEKARGRFGHSKIKQERYLSNPTLPGIGIDKLFQQSDQRHWFRKCTACNEWTCAELEFPACVKEYNDGRGYIACKGCGKPVGIYPGRWVPLYPDKKDIVGRHWSQLTSAYNDPADILNDFHHPKDGVLDDVMRLRLGRAYVSLDDKLRIQDVYAACTGEAQADRSFESCAMGVDVGKKKHVIIGQRIGVKEFEIIRVAVVDKFDDVHDLARRYSVKSAVVDIRPYEDEARAFQKAEPYMVYLCEYTDNALQDQVLNEKTRTIKAHRTGIFDKTGRMVREGQFIFPRRDPQINEFAAQLCNTAKRLEKNKRTGTDVYRYVKLGPEHYRNALNYFSLASQKAPRVKTRSYGRPVAKDCDMSYDCI